MKKPNNHPTKAESPHVAKHGEGFVHLGCSPLSSNNPKPRKDTVFFTNGNGVITTLPCILAGRELGTEAGNVSRAMLITPTPYGHASVPSIYGGAA